MLIPSSGASGLFSGMSNVGKSSLLNAITRTMKLAKAGPIAGCTRTIDWYKALKLPLEIIDLPGYGFTAGADFGEAVADFILQRKALRCCYVLVDARRGLVSPDLQLKDGDGVGEERGLLTSFSPTCL